MIDITRELEATQREVGKGTIPAGEGHVVRLRRTFDASIEDVWDAVTNPERITRWFLPISGDVRLGGHYQFEGNAGGEILECDRPNRLRVTWVYGDTSDPAAVSEVVLRLATAGEERTTFELEHTAVVPEEMWAMFGPGAVGVGWDGGMLGLSLHLLGGVRPDDPIAWQLSDEGREFNTRASVLWGEANIAAGADPETARQAVIGTTNFYAPPSEAGAEG